MSSFESCSMAPPDPIFHLAASCKADPDPSKINLGIGAYRGNDGKPWILPVVKKAEGLITGDASLDHEYLPISGLESFTAASVKLILGLNSPAIAQDRVAAVQTLSGTGAVRLGAEFLHRFRNKPPVYISNPTWGNHRAIFEDAGFTDIREYNYWDASTRSLDFNATFKAFQDAPEGSIMLIHPCAHNPTGVDPTMDQWKSFASILKSKNHTVFFDCAYQGFASGSLDKDAAAIRYFVDQGFELVIAQSYAKNFGLYNERVGCLSVVTSNSAVSKRVFSQLCKIIRPMYSNPPAFGARLVSLVLNDPVLFNEWETQLKSMAGRIIQMRTALFQALVQKKTPGTWNHVVDQIGMFSYTGLNGPQVKVLIEKYHVYLASNGRISMAGLNTSNVVRFAEAIDWVVRNV